MNYQNVLLKLSGEALLGDNGIFISHQKLKEFVFEIKSIVDMGIKLSLVVGGGNIIRGENSKGLEISRYKMDNIGMLSTVMNAIALEDYLSKEGIFSRVLSSMEMPKICDFYNAQKAISYLNENKVVIFAGGIGNPYFSTDTAAILRAMETQADIVLKGTQVDGVFNKDPKKYADAVKIERISHTDLVRKKLSVLDLTSVLLAEKVNLPIKIFNIHNKGNVKKALLEDTFGSIIVS